jgi:hypothetical protein
MLDVSSWGRAKSGMLLLKKVLDKKVRIQTRFPGPLGDLLMQQDPIRPTLLDPLSNKSLVALECIVGDL